MNGNLCGLQAGEGYGEIWLLTDSLTNQAWSPAWLGFLSVYHIGSDRQVCGPLRMPEGLPHPLSLLAGPGGGPQEWR